MSWIDVHNMRRRGHLQPQVLFFEAVLWICYSKLPTSSQNHLFIQTKFWGASLLEQHIVKGTGTGTEVLFPIG